MTERRTKLPELADAMSVLSHCNLGDNRANVACAEAAARLLQLHADIAHVLPALSVVSANSRRKPAGQAFRAAVDRLAGEVLA